MAQSKLFTLLGLIQKARLPGSNLKKGFCKENELWIARANKLIYKIVKEEGEEGGDDNAEEDQFDIAGLCKLHKRNTKFVEKEVTAARLAVSAKLSKLKDDDNKEWVLRLKEQVRRLITMETLFLTLCPLVLIPQAGKDSELIASTLEELEELKECYSNLGL